MAASDALGGSAAITLGVRPEYVALVAADMPGAVPAVVTQAQDIGTYWLVSAQLGGHLVRLRLDPEAAVPRAGDEVWLALLGEHSCFYAEDERLIEEGVR